MSSQTGWIFKCPSGQVFPLLYQKRPQGGSISSCSSFWFSGCFFFFFLCNFIFSVEGDLISEVGFVLGEEELVSVILRRVSIFFGVLSRIGYHSVFHRRPCANSRSFQIIYMICSNSCIFNPNLLVCRSLQNVLKIIMSCFFFLTESVLFASYFICMNLWLPPLGDICLSLTSLRRRQWHPTPVLLAGKSHGQRSLMGCSPWGREESDRTERLHFPFTSLRMIISWSIPAAPSPSLSLFFFYLWVYSSVPMGQLVFIYRWIFPLMLCLGCCG